jgi:hypothetical protein
MIALITRAAGMFGLSLAPLWAGAIAALLIGGGFGVYSLKLYNAGYRSADSKCQAAALQSEIDALKADRDNAKRAAGDAALRLATIEKQSTENQERTSAYVAELERAAAAPPPKDGKPAVGKPCALTAADLRGMRAPVARARPIRPRPSVGPRWLAPAGSGPAVKAR